MRIRLRDALFQRLELGRGSRAKYFIIGHPKSGNTWLRTLISRLYQQRYQLPDDLILKSDELHLANPACPNFLVTNGWYCYERAVARALRNGARFRDRKVLLLARHPADIAVSWHLQFTKRISVYKRELINATLRNPVNHENVSKWDFVMNEEIGLPSLIEFLNQWEKTLEGLPHTMITRYEDLRLRPVETLSSIMTFFEQDFSEEEIAAAAAFGSFENMRKLETGGALSRGGYAKYKAGDPETAKVRRGQILGYRDDFDEDQVAVIERLFDRLSPTFGYTGSEVGPIRPAK